MKRLNHKMKKVLIVILLASLFVGCEATRMSISFENNIQDLVIDEEIHEENHFLEEKSQSNLPLEVFFSEQNNNRDFSEWFQRNTDFVGWISIPETEISQAVVRGRDNEEYLRKNLDGKYSQAGTVFMDYRNIGNEFDSNMILYGHNLKDDQMFGSLRSFLDEQYEKEHQIVVYESLYDVERYEVFSVYRVQAETYLYELELEGEKFQDYIQDLSDLSEVEMESPVLPVTKIITLSTCSYEEKNERLVVHAALISKK